MHKMEETIQNMLRPDPQPASTKAVWDKSEKVHREGIFRGRGCFPAGQLPTERADISGQLTGMFRRGFG